MPKPRGEKDDPSVGFLAELKKRNVFRVAVLYLVGSWLILQIADTVIPALYLPDWSLTLILVLLALGFPIALLFAWIFELTPDGLKREHEVDRSQSIAPTTGRRIDFLIIGVLSVVIVLLVADRFINTSTPKADTARSIAVLPFLNMNGDAETAAFSDGLAETLLNMLAQIDTLKVAARTSSFQFRDRTGDVTEIAKALNVGTLLEGSIQRWGDEIKVTAQLIDASNGFHLWSNEYRRADLANVFSIQEDIANQVVKSLELKLLPDSVKSDAVGTANIKAYEQYLQGRYEQNGFSFKSLPNAERLYKAAIAVDPQFSKAYFRLAQTYLDMQQTGLIRYEEALEKVEPLIDKVRSLSGNTADLLTLTAALSDLQTGRGVDGARSATEKLFLQALELEPNNVDALGGYAAFLYNRVDRPLEAVQYAKRGLALDPRSDQLLSVYGGALRSLGKTEESLEQYKLLRTYYPHMPHGYYLASFTLLQAGQFADALVLLRKAMEVDPADHELPVEIGKVLTDVGDFESSRAWFDYALTIDETSIAARTALMDLHAALGEDEKGLAIARQLLEDGGPVRQGARWLALWWMFYHGWNEKNFAEFYHWLDEFYPGLMQQPPVLNTGSKGYASLLVRALLADAQPERARALADRLLQIYAADAEQAARQNLQDRVVIHAVLGDIDKAVEYFEAVERLQSLRAFWAFHVEPELDPLRSDARFQAIDRRVTVHFTAEREKIYARNDHLVTKK